MVFQYLVECRSGTQQFKNIAHANSHAPNAWATAALRIVYGYPVKAI